MSVTLEFNSIENNEDAILSRNKTCGIYEVDLNKIKITRQWYTKNTGIFAQLLTNPGDIWSDEVYDLPSVDKFLFYILARDFESNIGFREADGTYYCIAFDPKPIFDIISLMRLKIDSINDSFRDLEELLNEAVENKNLITVYWG